MAFGFIPRQDQEGEQSLCRDELSETGVRWAARQLAEALERDMMIKRAEKAVFKQARRYAVQLEKLDPGGHNAAQEVGNVVLALSYAETAQERLEVLAREARRLMLAVTEAKRQHAEGTKALTTLDRIRPYAQALRLALLGAAFGLLWGLVAEGGWSFGQ
jgi:hypothetical protein